MESIGLRDVDGRILPELRRRCETTGDKCLYVPRDVLSKAYAEMLLSRNRPAATLNRRQADSARLLHTVKWAGLKLISTSEMPIRPDHKDVR